MRERMSEVLRLVIMAVLLLTLVGCGVTPAAEAPAEPAVAAEAPAEPAVAEFAITMEGVWARPVKQGHMGTTSAIYGLFTNTAGTDDVLIMAASDVAMKAEIHETTMVDHVMKMQEVGRFDIPAGTTLELKPGGKHIMLIGMKQELKLGDSFTVTLTFEKAGEREIQVTVQEMP